jgi:YesN/AraC family two-component response regulator
MVDTMEQFQNREIKQTGLLYLFLYYLIENAGKSIFCNTITQGKELYVQKAVDFIEKNFSRNIRIGEIANYINIDRGYLHALFKEYLSLSPQTFLIEFRINKACDLLQNTSLNIGDISRSVGYQDTLLFSKTFKKVKGISPSKYRKKVT